MKSSVKGRGRGIVAALVVLGLVIGLHLAAPSQAYSDAVPQILGNTYGELSAAWWQWAVIEPAATNPLVQSNATTNNYAGIAALNQRGPVWFLAGEALDLIGTAVTRNVTIPSKEYIFFPNC